MCVQWEKENIRTGRRQLLHEGEGRRGLLRRSLAGVHLKTEELPYFATRGLRMIGILKMKLRV